MEHPLKHDNVARQAIRAALHKTLDQWEALNIAERILWDDEKGVIESVIDKVLEEIDGVTRHSVDTFFDLLMTRPEPIEDDYCYMLSYVGTATPTMHRRMVGQEMYAFYRDLLEHDGAKVIQVFVFDGEWVLDRQVTKGDVFTKDE